MAKIVNEASAFSARIRFFGSGRTPQTPATARYRIRDLTNDRIVRDWTEITPASSVEIQITADDNLVYRDSSTKARRFRTEDRVISIQADYDTDNQYTGDFPYSVRNLRGFDS